MWSYFAVAYSRRPLPHSHPKTPGGSEAGDQRSAAPVSRGPQHTRLSQHAAQPCPLLPGGQAAMGVFDVWPRARLPQLGPPLRARGQRPAGVSHVPDGGAVCTTVAGLRSGLLRGHGCPHACLRTMWTRVFREVRQVLGGDPSASRHPRFPRRLPLLCHTAQP